MCIYTHEYIHTHTHTSHHIAYIIYTQEKPTLCDREATQDKSSPEWLQASGWALDSEALLKLHEVTERSPGESMPFIRPGARLPFDMTYLFILLCLLS